MIYNTSEILHIYTIGVYFIVSSTIFNDFEDDINSLKTPNHVACTA